MRKLLIVITSLIFSTAIFCQGNLSDSSKGLKIQYRDTCYELQKQATLRQIGHGNSEPLIVANGIVIRSSEIKKEMIDFIFIIKCPQSFEKFGDAGSMGVIAITTKQKFKTVTIGELAKQEEMESDRRQISYALNGYLITDTSQRISLKAIKRIDMINRKVAGEGNNATTCFSIWTITRKEIRQYNNRPKLCRGVGNAYTNR